MTKHIIKLLILLFVSLIFWSCMSVQNEQELNEPQQGGGQLNSPYIELNPPDMELSPPDMELSPPDMELSSPDMELSSPDMEPVSSCGDGVRSPDEMCDEPDPECVSCTIPCSYQGGRACGGNTIPGDPQMLYECNGSEFVIIADCGEPCERMPLGVPDRCPSSEPVLSDPPTRLLQTLRVTPYVEQNCTPTTFGGWPYEAKRCSYTTGGLSSVVITATPSPRRVALWIMDAVTLIPTLDDLKHSAYESYTDGLVMIAVNVLNQSSRIFPLSGDIVENLGGGYTRYPFSRGVTEGCSSGCYCRINSLHRTEWCAYEASQGGSESSCLNRVGRSGLTQAWGDHCLQNHINAWDSSINEHFRARAYRYQQSIRGRCPNIGSCSAQQVINALQRAL